MTCHQKYAIELVVEIRVFTGNLICARVVFIIYQLLSSGLQPFIYFQF